MASVCNDQHGLKRIIFTAGDGSRRTIRLGKCSQRQAEAVKVRVENIVAACFTTGTADDETNRWVASLDDAMHAKLAAVGLVAGRERSAMTLAAFLEEYFKTLTVKGGTATAYNHTRRCLLDHFGADKPLRNIEPPDAERWKTWLKTDQKLSEATTSRRIGVARMFFHRAAKWKLIAENPFSDVKAGSQTNKSRMFFVTRDMADKVLAACPDDQWRLLFALSRYGGLRCPSEHLALKWSDIDWEHNRITVHSPKTEHHTGGDMRLIPLFPELHPLLLEAFTQAEPGEEHVITHYRGANQNLRTQFERIIKRAGLLPWPKPFQNLRSSRETELCERWPEHVVCQWIGNSQTVARKHYLQVTDEHFEQAAIAPENDPEKSAQKAARHMHAQGCTGSHDPRFQAKNGNMRVNASACEGGMGVTGLEPVTSRV